MNYELAKKLKDAGFSWVTRWEVENNYRRQIMVQGESLPPLGALLSEIKKSKDENESVLNLSYIPHSNEWYAYFTDGQSDQYWGLYNKTGYPTPEEAVANLWLTLNAK